jgi:hypothetical protein
VSPDENSPLFLPQRVIEKERETLQFFRLIFIENIQKCEVNEVIIENTVIKSELWIAKFSSPFQFAKFLSTFFESKLLKLFALCSNFL